MADLFVLLVVAAIAWYAGSFVTAFRRRRSEIAFRRASLRYDEATQLYHWKTKDGRSHSDDKHPDKPGGVWYEAELQAVSQLRS